MKVRAFLVVLLVVFISTTSVFSHPGRTDSSGGHYVRKSGWGYPVGSYHYHNGGTSSSISTSNTYSNSNNAYSIARKPDFLISYGTNNVTDNYSAPVRFSSYPLVIKLSSASSILSIHDWYIWNYGVGWVWFSSEYTPVCQVWKQGASIKLVLDHDDSNCMVHNVNAVLIPQFSIQYHGIDINEKYISAPSLPINISLKNETSEYNSLDWYIWNDGPGWVWFSSEANPDCVVWKKGAAIKLIVNKNPEAYQTHTFSAYLK